MDEVGIDHDPSEPTTTDIIQGGPSPPPLPHAQTFGDGPSTTTTMVWTCASGDARVFPSRIKCFLILVK
jgi:hypothetical protein